MTSQNSDVVKLIQHRHHPIKQPTYLANPYSHPERVVMNARLTAVTEILTHLTNNGVTAFAAVAYTSRIQAQGATPPQGWYHYDLGFLAGCQSLTLLKFPGWESSYGVQLELAVANLREIPISDMEWPDIKEFISAETSATMERAGSDHQPEPPQQPIMLVDDEAIASYAYDHMSGLELTAGQVQRARETLQYMLERNNIMRTVFDYLEASITSLD